MSMTDVTSIVQSVAQPLTMLIVVLGLLMIAMRGLSIAHDLSKTLMGLMAKPQPAPEPATPQLEPKKAPPVPESKPAPAPAPEPKPAPVPPKLPTEYDRMWAAMVVSQEHQAAVINDAKKILAHKSDYESVSQESGVPWFVIGLFDVMEAGGGCKAHLHNGDPLEHRTIHVPEGRPPPPAEPPFSWPQSALDALKFEGLDKIKNWPLSTIAGALEKYNGLGYHSRGVPSPYLWSFSNQYHSGKFVKDHEYDPNAISGQAGAMPILKALIGLDSTIQI